MVGFIASPLSAGAVLSLHFLVVLRFAGIHFISDNDKFNTAMTEDARRTRCF